VAGTLTLLYNYATGEWKSDKDDIFKVGGNIIDTLSAADRHFLQVIQERHPEHLGDGMYNYFAMMLKIDRNKAYETLMPLYDRMSLPGNLGHQRAVELINRFIEGNPGDMWKNVERNA